MATEKTNAARLLDRAKIGYELVAYEVDEADLSAVHVAQQLNEPVEQVFKTLVLKGDRSGYFVCVIPGAEELDLKKAAKLSGNKSCEMIPMKELLPITGYIRGACSPIGMKKRFAIYIHESCNAFNRIYISAGKRGLQLYLSPQELVALVGATVGFLILEPENE
ncbi:Cys-tRNA(Pro) deacylase [Acetobacteroides hydrogenigenes]|uniref:Cys-tRNA(Pro)/Cys-tRNA(Cys) deacylase n=1 Tax=Acetobacteroides hydrogenigenes TaxID=979970 RepID=A0A4R2EWA4_9BACT|nr:Cys-tRNA(Pro) deacylase [Acetobacteroides hydrogenigenes]TCN68969.1 Cys-tRNA(Pro)/Cys-tRNA(Cys) deacylase [Acetobacteroides hydrogenigenes]